MNSLLKRNWWRVGSVIAASPLLLPLWASAATRTASASGLLWCATVGMRPEELREVILSHAQHLVSSAAPVIYRDGFGAVTAHQQSGDRVVIVTGSSCELADAFCAAAGLEGVRVVGSTLRFRAGGWILDEHCVGARKVSMLAAAGVAPPWSVVYTDSASDLPLLRLAERRCVVNARRGNLRRVRQALVPGSFELLRWE